MSGLIRIFIVSSSRLMGLLLLNPLPSIMGIKVVAVVLSKTSFSLNLLDSSEVASPVT